MSVSRNDHRKKISDPARGKEVGLAFISEPEPGFIQCSCGGFTAFHVRSKVREDKAQRHLDKRHGGQGAWL